MSWQQSPSMNSLNGGAVGGDHGGPVATEYTLQGVMRFLQIEWHNHERARNAWDIERAEMKAKIAKNEGEFIKLKRSNEVLEKHIKMLEKALRDERKKSQTLASGGKPTAEDELQKEVKGKGAFKPELGVGASKPPNKVQDFEGAADAERDVQIDKSRKYLTKCFDEVIYLLLPPSHPPPPQSNLQSLANSNYIGQDPPMTMEEAFLQRQKAQQTNLHHQMMPNHQPPPVPDPPSVMPNVMHLAQAAQQPHQAELMVREQAGQQHYPHAQTLLSSPFPTSQSQAHSVFSAAEESGNNIAHGYSNFEVARENGLNNRQQHPDSSEGFIFDETNSMSEHNQPALPPRRPDTDLFPSANSIPVRSPPRTAPGSHRRRGSGSTSMVRRRSQEHEVRDSPLSASKSNPNEFKVKFALRGHLDVVRSVIFTGGGSPSEPEICTAGDDGMIKRWIIPASYGNFGQHAVSSDLDIQSYFTHRGHEGVVTSLAACPPTGFSTGGRASGDGWIFSGGQDATVRVWERGRVDPKATLDGHTDAVWAVCVLPASCGLVFGADSSKYGGADRVLLASGSADGTIKLWAVSAPPQLSSPQTGSKRGVGGSRRHSVTSGSNFPSSPQPSVATATPFHYTLIHSIPRAGFASPTCISPLSPSGETFVVSFNDSSILIFDTRTGEEMIGMASGETYNGTPATGVNTVVATSMGLEGAMGVDGGRSLSEDDNVVHAATGSSASGGVEGVIISGHEDKYIRFFDANSGQCTYSMVAHGSAVSSLSLSKNGREAVSAGHDASIRFWDLEKRVCIQEVTTHRVMRGEGVCSVVWSQDGRLVVGAGGDGVVKVFAR
ncbi:WD40 repeat-like protein [Trichodelitschia bisporula]|uniref:WD40 repeat-like protein n=1 Tax=Trichodelitschia bisporula TaxID=703511 RepID=A0A6G1I7Q3_9PEZI|nr:WD40 repeat-like protein [Trichodelitschia bisporula]